MTNVQAMRARKRAVVLPAPLLVGLFAFPALLSIASIFQAQYRLPVLLVDAALLLIALVDLFAFRRIALEMTVDGRDILSIGQKNAVFVQITTGTDLRLALSIYPDIPVEFECPERGPDGIKVSLKKGQQEFRYHLIPEKRGAYTLGAHHLRTQSRLGLWKRQERFDTARKVRVYPDLAVIRTYELLARQHRQYALVRASRLRGGESEFARLRDYTSDDDYRFIDWKATARRNKLTTKEFQLESDQNVFLILDSGRLMTGQVAGLSQFDLALNAALLMAHVAQSGGDRVGLMAFDEEVHAFLPPQGGPKATARLVQATYALHPKMVESAFRKALSVFDSRIKQRCLLVLFTQLLDDTQVRELSDQLRLLGRKHLPLVILLEDTELTKMAMGAIEPGDEKGKLYDRGAAAELLMWKHRAVTQLKETGAHVIESPARSLSNKVVNRYLEVKAQHSL